MRILVLGDIVAKDGRRILRERLPALQKLLAVDCILANGENSAGGFGYTPETLNELFNMGIAGITGGNHSWKYKETLPHLNKENRVVRPANYPDPAPGRGEMILTLNDGRKLAVLNLEGVTFMNALPCPFEAARQWTEKMDIEHPEIKIRVVDFHAEATSEKKCMGFFLDGKVSAVLGSHTHVQTADAQILPKGTAYMTDMGMCGVESSCLGMTPESVLPRFITKRPVMFKVAQGTASINGILLDIDDETGLATHVQIIRENAPRCSAGFMESK